MRGQLRVSGDWRGTHLRVLIAPEYYLQVTGGELTCEPDPIPFNDPGRVIHDQVLHDHDLHDQVLQGHQVPQRTFQSKEQEDDVVTFKLDCLKCDESYTFEVWAVDKEDNM